MKPQTFTVACPDCGGTLRIDATTGHLLSHRSTRKKTPAKDFDALLADVDAGTARADEVFQQELRKLDDRSRLLDETFRQAVQRAEEEDDGKPPTRPWDLD